MPDGEPVKSSRVGDDELRTFERELAGFTTFSTCSSRLPTTQDLKDESGTNLAVKTAEEKMLGARELRLQQGLGFSWWSSPSANSQTARSAYGIALHAAVIYSCGHQMIPSPCVISVLTAFQAR